MIRGDEGRVDHVATGMEEDSQAVVLEAGEAASGAPDLLQPTMAFFKRTFASPALSVR